MVAKAKDQRQELQKEEKDSRSKGNEQEVKPPIGEVPFDEKFNPFY